MNSWFTSFTVTGLLQHWQLSVQQYVFVMVAEGGLLMLQLQLHFAFAF